MNLRIIGSGTVAPSPTRTAPAHWIDAGSVRLLLDCGAGTLHRAAGFGIPWDSVSHVALTHFHVDHWGEVPHLLFALRWGVVPPRTAPLVVIGPEGLRDRLRHLAGALGDWLLAPGFPLEVTEIRHGETIALAPDVHIEAHNTPHTTESLAFAISHAGARLVYTGDTGPSDALAGWAAGCTLLLAECSLPEAEAVDIHLTPLQAGALAQAAHAGRLVLTHFYPPVETAEPAERAAEVYDGVVVAAEDGDRFTIESG